MTKQQNDCFMEVALVASFIPLGDNFHSRFVCECVQYVQFIFISWDVWFLLFFAFDVLFPLGGGGGTSDGFGCVFCVVGGLCFGCFVGGWGGGGVVVVVGGGGGGGGITRDEWTGHIHLIPTNLFQCRP